MRATLLLALALALPAARARAAGPAPAAPPVGPTPEAVSFDEAVRRAAERTTSALLAGQEIRRAEALLAQARAGSLPYLSANATSFSGRTVTW